MNRRGRWLAGGLVATVLAVLALLAAPSEALAADVPWCGGSGLVVAAAHDGGDGSTPRPVWHRLLGETAAAAITQRGSAAIWTGAELAAVPLVVLGLLSPVARRRTGRDAVRLPAVRAPPLPVV